MCSLSNKTFWVKNRAKMVSIKNTKTPKPQRVIIVLIIQPLKLEIEIDKRIIGCLDAGQQG
jgi:hypothetical protein